MKQTAWPSAGENPFMTQAGRVAGRIQKDRPMLWGLVTGLQVTEIETFQALRGIASVLPVTRPEHQDCRFL
jgi:hypothetical protein